MDVCNGFQECGLRLLSFIIGDMRKMKKFNIHRVCVHRIALGIMVLSILLFSGISASDVNIPYNNIGIPSFGGAPVIIPLMTTYEPLSGGIANEVTSNFIINVGIIDMGTGINTASVIADVSSVNTTGIVSMDLNGSYAGIGQITYFNKTVKVDKVVRGIFNVTVTAYDNSGASSSGNLVVVAYMYPGVKVTGYNSSKNVPAHPANASFFYNNSPVEIIVNTTDNTNYTNVTANFMEVDGSITLEYNNSGVLLQDGNYSYKITHTLGTIPDHDAKIVWINVTMPTAYGNFTIPRIGALLVLSNMNPAEQPGSDLGGNTTNWRDIPDYSAVYLVFEPYNDSKKIATLKFNEPIDLTERTTAMNLNSLGDKLRIAGKSMDINASADALKEFNKPATLTIYNLTAFTTMPGILQDGVLIVPPGQTTGGGVTQLNWDNSTYTLTIDVSHWTEYSWDGELPSVIPGDVGYPSGQNSVKAGQSIVLNVTAMDLFSGVLNVTVNATNISTGIINLNNTMNNVWSNVTKVNIGTSGNYILNVIAYDRATNINNSRTIMVVVDSSTFSPTPTVTSTPTQSPDGNISGYADPDGMVQRSGAVNAVVDYFNGIITRQEAMEVVLAYFRG